ncbi:SDR family oxidoreductase [Algoriphagus sp. D3-2-R+10]|uniref:dTDP-4-dehydrorhamnose reductase family protein n=1 Tax=Algoriphagus aurantiacus TaxID=3103948 RepID=UPI002B3CD9D9|nr:SDR family oxidoreductase [Algoriphagus sp. D3-2-R+10]MEB2778407.1 SDR family oxidoreductase [Algoriphagus sp. D3-2-R+10]
MQKLLILGSTGMLGHQVFFNMEKSKEFQVYDLSFRNKLRDQTIICDITDFTKLEKIIKEIRPDVLINCIGILIEGSNQNPKNSILINAYFPHWLTSVADEIDSKVIHISTDCVFSGKKGGYLESDFRDADDVYGRGKALGEIFSNKHLTLRTSIIGPEIKQKGEGLFHWFMKQEGEINGFTKAFWGGVTTIELSKVILSAIKQNLSGLYHVTNGISINKYDLLNLFKKYSNKNITINEVEGKHVDKSLSDTRKALNRQIPSYSKMIEEMITLIKTNPELYNNYRID